MKAFLIILIVLLIPSPEVNAQTDQAPTSPKAPPTPGSSRLKVSKEKHKQYELKKEAQDRERERQLALQGQSHQLINAKSPSVFAPNQQSTSNVYYSDEGNKKNIISPSENPSSMEKENSKYISPEIKTGRWEKKQE